MKSDKSVRRLGHCFLSYAAVFGALILISKPAVATGPMNTFIIGQTDSPVTIHQCDIRSDDAIDFHIEPDLRFTSLSPKTVVGIRFGLTFFKRDAINGKISLGPPVLFDWPRNDNATLAPYGSGGYHDAIGQASYSSSDSVGCSVLAVRFDDGSKWQAQAESPVSSSRPELPQSSATAAPSTQSTSVSSGDDHLWLGVGTGVNPLTDDHPKYCTVHEQVVIWKLSQCHFARIAWAVRKVPGRASSIPGNTPNSRVESSPTASASESPSKDHETLGKCGLPQATSYIRASTVDIKAGNQEMSNYLLREAIDVQKRCIADDNLGPIERDRIRALTSRLLTNRGIGFMKLSRSGEAKLNFDEASTLASTVLNDPVAPDDARTLASQVLSDVNKWNLKWNLK